MSDIAPLSNRDLRDLVARNLVELEAIKLNDFDRVIMLAQETLRYAERLGDFIAYAHALAYVSWAYGRLNQNLESFTTGIEALLLSRQHAAPYVESLVVNALAAAFFNIGAFDEAHTLYQYELSIADTLDDDSLRYVALHDRGVLFNIQGRYQEAATMFEQSLMLLPQHLHGGVRDIYLHNHLGDALMSLEKYEEALYHFEISLTRSQGDPSMARNFGETCVYIAYACCEIQDYGQAEMYLNQAAPYLNLPSAQNLRLNFQMTQARFFEATGNLAQAVATRETLYYYMLELQLLALAKTELENLVRLYGQMDDNENLLRTYQRMAQEVPQLQQKNSDMRLKILRLIFAQDKAAMQAELDLSQQKTAIMTRLSHEFRTPLSIIQTNSELVNRYSERMTLEQRQQRLNEISRQVQRMTLMLDDMMKLLREDVLLVSALAESITLRQVAETALSELTDYRQSAIRVRLHLPAPEAVIITHPAIIRTIMVHLLTNALKFSQAEVDLSLGIEIDTLVMIVHDTGIGIPQAEHHAVFQPLYRASNLDEVGGTGMGLAIVRKYVDDIGGHIKLHSIPGTGTTVTVRLPVMLSVD